jgi:hypothetical protein
VRLPIVAVVFLTAVTVGAGWLGESAMGLAATWLWNAWILAAFVVVFRVVARLEQVGSGPILGWSVGLALLTALGIASERALALLL